MKVDNHDLMIIRQAKRSDIENIASVQVSSWNTTYRGLLPDEIIDARTVESRIENMTTHWKGFEGDLVSRIVLVAENDTKEIVGFAAGGDIFHSGYSYDSEGYAFYVLEEYQQQGIGTLLMDELVTFLVSMNFKSMIIWVLEENPACEFCAKLGGIEKERKIDKYGEKEFLLIGYVWEDVRKLKKTLQKI